MVIPLFYSDKTGDKDDRIVTMCGNVWNVKNLSFNIAIFFIKTRLTFHRILTCSSSNPQISVRVISRMPLACSK